MRDYVVTVQGSDTIVELPEANFRMQVFKSDAHVLNGETAALEATLYIEKSSFIPVCSYLFELINSNGDKLNGCADIDLFKASVDFYFHSVLNTELFIKSVPKASILCPKELKEFHF